MLPPGMLEAGIAPAGRQVPAQGALLTWDTAGNERGLHCVPQRDLSTSSSHHLEPALIPWEGLCFDVIKKGVSRWD